jgi:hypothetical protein
MDRRNCAAIFVDDRGAQQVLLDLATTMANP